MSEVVVPGGAHYAVGDRVVALTPEAAGRLVTSQTATVVAINAGNGSLAVRTDDEGRTFTLQSDDISADRLAHAYAMTVHRSQGTTVDTAHAMEDGGGRELAYVKMSRARQRSTAYVVADSLDQAVEDLTRDWSAERRPTWAIDSGTPTTDPVAVETNHRVGAPMRAALRRARLVAERAAVEASIPADPSAEITQLERRREALRRRQEDLVAGREPHAGDPAASAALELRCAEQRCADIEATLSRRGLPWRDRRRLQGEVVEAESHRSTAEARWAEVGQPTLDQLNGAEKNVTERPGDLWDQRHERRSWLDDHPEAEHRLESLASEIDSLDINLAFARDAVHGRHPTGLELNRAPEPVLDRDIDLAL